MQTLQLGSLPAVEVSLFGRAGWRWGRGRGRGKVKGFVGRRIPGLEFGTGLGARCLDVCFRAECSGHVHASHPGSCCPGCLQGAMSERFHVAPGVRRDFSPAKPNIGWALLEYHTSILFS